MTVITGSGTPETVARTGPRDGSARPSRAHLLHVFPSFGRGGVPLRICDVANRLGRAYRHTFLALDGDVSAGKRLAPSLEAQCRALPVSRYHIWDSVRAYRQLLREEQPDLLLTYNWGAIECALANSLPGTRPHIHFESGFGPEEADRQLKRRIFMRRLALRRSHRIVVPSQKLQVLATGAWGFDRRRVQYIPNGVDLDRYDGQPGQVVPLPEMEDAASITIGTVAPLRPEKNVARLLTAFAALDRTDLRLVIAGDGAERKALEALAGQLGIASVTTFLGHRDDVPRVLRGLDIYAITSDTEQMPNSLLQAMAAGRPVAAVDVGDVAAILSPESRAYVCARDDEAELVRCLGRLVDDGALRKKLGHANQSRVRAVYGLDGMVEAYRALFDGALATPRTTVSARAVDGMADVKI